MRTSKEIRSEIDKLQKELVALEETENIIEHVLDNIEVSLLSGAYEPSERGAGFCSSESGREEALIILKAAVDRIIRINK